MILGQVIELFDEELDRLHRLREIVTGLQRPFVLPAAAEAQAALEDLPGQNATSGPELVEAAKPARRSKGTARRARLPRERKSPSPTVPESTALRGSIPKGPVVVPAAQVRSQTVKASARPAVRETAAPEPGSLGSMIRALRLGAS